MVTSEYIDFGNGITAYLAPGAGVATLEAGHYGFDVPEFEVPVTEHGVGDGGTIGTSRANARHMRATIAHNQKWTRRQIMQAFTPGVERTVMTSLGSMPYYVEALTFPDNLWEASRRFSVNLVSPLAYPEGTLHTEATQYAWTVASVSGTPAFSVSGLPDTGGARIAGQAFTIPAGNRLTQAGFYLSAQNPTSVDVAISAGAFSVYTTLIVRDPGFYCVSCDEVFAVETAAELTVAVASSDTYLKAYELLDGSAAGNGFHFAADYSVVLGDGTDTTMDWGHTYTYGENTTNTTGTVITTDSDLPCAPKTTITLGADTSSLTLTDGTRTATIAGTMVTGDVVVIDSAAHTVTVNGTNRLAWFDRTGSWPLLSGTQTTLTTNVASTIAVEWRPRMMGLI